MKKNFIYLLLLCSLIVQAQVTPSYPTIKLTKTVEGVKQDSLLVVGTDKIVKHIPYSKISNVREYATASALPITGVAGKLYITKDNNKIYTWNGTFYSEFVGAKGDKGDQGLKGDQGIQGVAGLTGLKGDKGDVGLTGSIGLTGAKGDQGIQGIQGFKGDTGLTGADGAMGVQGPQGIQGETGLRGIQGETGPQGLIGLAGATGSQGIQGVKGDKGDQGIQGIQGLKGDTGAKGDTGSFNGDITADQVTETATRKFQTPTQSAYNDATSSIQGQLNNKPSKTGLGASGIWPIGITGNSSSSSKVRINYYGNLDINAIPSGMEDNTVDYSYSVLNTNGPRTNRSLVITTRISETVWTQMFISTEPFSGANNEEFVRTNHFGSVGNWVRKWDSVNFNPDGKVDKVAGKSLLSDTEITRLATLSNYTHPTNHPPSIITQDASNRFVTDAEKTAWNAKQGALGFTPENSINKNTANGYAGLGSDGKLISSQLPSITISDTFVTASQAAMLALTAETGDVAVRTDLNKSFILKGTNSAVLADWQELLTPISAVTTVFGRNGAVVAQSGDYSADQVNETATRKFQTANQATYSDATSSIQTQLNSKEPSFAKNTAFNKNYGATSGTVAQGNDSRILNGQTAFGWGNHASVGYALTTGSNINQSSFRTALGLGSNAYSSTAYLPLAGGTLSGKTGIALSSSGLNLNNSSFFVNNTSNTKGGIFGYNDVDDSFYINIIEYGVAAKTLKVDASQVNFSSSVTATSFNGSATLTGTPTAPTAAAGTNTTQIATTAFVQSNSRPYKVYTALLTQYGTSAPTATVLENTLGGTVVWSRNIVGLYLGTLENGFSSTLSKVRVFISGGEPSLNTTGFYNALPNNIDSVQVNTRNTSGSLADNLMTSGATIEIRVYN